MSSPDDESPNDNSTPDEDDPSIDDPDWAANIVQRAVRKAQSGQTAIPAESATIVETSPQDELPPNLAAPDQLRVAPEVPREEVAASHTATNVAVAEHENPSSGVDPAGDERPDDETRMGRRARKAAEQENSGIQIRQLVEWIVVIVGALVVALVIKAFLIQPFYIPSGSMSPTLNNDDRILVNKLSYDLHEVNRGDIVVFETPENFPNRDVDNLVKRVIGLEGETIDFADGRVVIDDRLLEEPYIEDEVQSSWTAGLPPGCISETSSTKEGCTIPDGHVFVMGDNRTGSDDGRVFGPIPEDLIVGRAFLRVWPLGEIGFL